MVLSHQKTLVTCGSAAGPSLNIAPILSNEKMTQTRPVEEIRLGGYIPEEHIKDMDTDGIDVSIVYTTVGGTMYNLRTAIF